MPDWLSIANFQEIAGEHRIIGTFIALLLPMIEAFLPFLPLAAFVVANATAYGLWLGFLLSWGGAVIGSYCVFLIIRKYGHNRFFGFITNRPSIQKLIRWVEMQGFMPLFILLCFPFTPSSVVNVVAGLSNLKKKSYLLTIMSAKFVMILVISWIGSDLQSLITKPWKTVLIIIAILIMWLGGKWVEKNNAKKMEEHLRNLNKDTKE
ncbi:TVP38/TMEM64 family protein [Kurthia zopfii]|uniref:TVP38/TMEM64 family protein n=1 Tax=Kurthia zopfii TaxID=1650 RepID=UPI000F6C3DF4|nr:TVP38/TMEM64 family protein [Kurthia zopfii]VEI04955.1 TVP38/TMEM64 family inner membrane protein ydjZ [Kurthia zopfii]